jgi:cytosine/adenosine deaminase-related metal-dependent hydrolase
MCGVHVPNVSDSESFVIDARYLLADPAGGVLVADGRVVVRGGAIVAVGSAADVAVPAGAPRRTFDLVLPGLINAHHHAYVRSPARAGCPDMALEPWPVG